MGGTAGSAGGATGAAGSSAGGATGAAGTNAAGAGGSAGGAAGTNAGGATGAAGSSAGGAGGAGGSAGGAAGTNAGGATGAAGSSAAGAGGSTGSGGGPALDRIFEFGNFSPRPMPKPCDASGACPDGQTCFRLTADVTVCDVAQRAVPTTCSWPTDECECAGRTCGAGTVCVQTTDSASSVNKCLEPSCASPSQCSAGSVCTPTSFILGHLGASVPGGLSAGRCFTPVCRSDADCSGGGGGRCALVLGDEANFDRYLSKVGCVFEGTAASATACAPSQATQVKIKSDSPTPYYTCAGR